MIKKPERKEVAERLRQIEKGNATEDKVQQGTKSPYKCIRRNRSRHVKHTNNGAKEASKYRCHSIEMS